MKKMLILLLLVFTCGVCLAKEKVKSNLVVTVSPKGTVVYINNKTFHPPFSTNLKPGSYKLYVTKEGYNGIWYPFKIPVKSVTHLHIALTKYTGYEPSEGRPTTVLPYDCPHFRIWWNATIDKYQIVPNIPFDNQQPPKYFFKKYWRKYETYGKEALRWMESHQLVAKNNTEWWGQEWWPNGVKPPTIRPNKRH